MPSSLGPAEILVILVVALIVLGPKRLPEAGRQVGKAIAEMRRWSQSIQGEVRSVIDAAEVTDKPVSPGGPKPAASAPPDKAEESPDKPEESPDKPEEAPAPLPEATHEADPAAEADGEQHVPRDSSGN